jgi:hypothetical protein
MELAEELPVVEELELLELVSFTTLPSFIIALTLILFSFPQAV